MVLIVTYDLRKPQKDYSSLIDALKALKAVWKPLLSAWLVDTASSPAEIRDYLAKFMDENDGLFVAQLVRNWATKGLSPQGIEWLKSRTF